MSTAAAAAEGNEVGKGVSHKEEKEGAFLLGSPTYVDLGGGKFRCEETGHELPASEMESYGKNKHCRIALIDAAVAKNKAPLNLFKLDPCSKSKLVCKLTGVTINKSEEHIWKHISGRKFLKKLEEKEEENDAEVEEKKQKKNKSLSNKSSQNRLEDFVAKDESGDDDEEIDFWMPPVGDRWDMDDGNERWNSSESSDNTSVEDDMKDVADQNNQINTDLKDLNKRTKRMAIEIGPRTNASRKKKKKVDHALDLP